LQLTEATDIAKYVRPLANTVICQH
jgi:hypothetical protein